MDKKEVEKLKQEAGSVKFTTATFKTHSNKCDATSFNKNSGRLCYWCIDVKISPIRGTENPVHDLIESMPGTIWFING